MARKPASPRVNCEISKDILDSAKQADSTHCAIAEAVRAAVPRATKIAVDLATVRFTDPDRGLRYTYLTPRIAQQFIVRFDHAMDVEPFAFQLRQAHVTRSGSNKRKRALTEGAKDTLRESAKRARAVAMGTTELVDRKKVGGVPDRVGGRTPPMQVGPDGVPFSRRRAYGLRALAL